MLTWTIKVGKKLLPFLSPLNNFSHDSRKLLFLYYTEFHPIWLGHKSILGVKRE